MKALGGVELKRFLRNYRRQNRPAADVAAVLQSVEYPVNVGSIFRLADGAGIRELVLSGITPIPPNPTIRRVGRTKDRVVPWRYVRDPDDAIQSMRNQGYTIVAMEITAESVPYDRFDFPAKSCLVVGHEDHGLTKKTLAACDSAIFVPMYGRGRSLNVHVALAIVVYHILHSGKRPPQ